MGADPFFQVRQDQVIAGGNALNADESGQWEVLPEVPREYRGIGVSEANVPGKLTAIEII